jgi:hypothetical protein
MPADALSPASVMAALSSYLDFDRAGQDLAANSDTAPPRRAGLIRKGMLLQEVAAMLGAPAKSAERKEGTLGVRTDEYVTPDGRVTAEFVEGVLVRYTMTSD